MLARSQKCKASHWLRLARLCSTPLSQDRRIEALLAADLAWQKTNADIDI
jgi:hypothetical protein